MQAMVKRSSQSAGADIELPVLPGGGPRVRRPNVPVFAVLSVALRFAGRRFQLQPQNGSGLRLAGEAPQVEQCLVITCFAAAPKER